MAGPDIIRLSALLKEKYIMLDLDGKDKKKVLAELVSGIASIARIRNSKEILASLIKREKLGSTGIGNGVAIPHTRSPKVKDLSWRLGVKLRELILARLTARRRIFFSYCYHPKKRWVAISKYLLKSPV